MAYRLKARKGAKFSNTATGRAMQAQYNKENQVYVSSPTRVLPEVVITSSRNPQLDRTREVLNDNQLFNDSLDSYGEENYGHNAWHDIKLGAALGYNWQYNNIRRKFRRSLEDFIKGPY